VTAFPGVPPCPSEALVEEQEGIAGLNLEDDVGLGRGTGMELRLGPYLPLDRLGIVRCNDPAREREVRKVPAIGVERGIGEIGWTGKCEFVSAGGRMPAPGR
jgi:hypothetical protein